MLQCVQHMLAVWQELILSHWRGKNDNARYRAPTAQSLTQEARSEFKHRGGCWSQDGLSAALLHPSCLQALNSVARPVCRKLLLVLGWAQGTGDALGTRSPSMVWHDSDHREGDQRSQVEFPRSWSRHTNTDILIQMTAPSLPGLTQVLPNSTAILQLWAWYLWVMGPKKVPAWKHSLCSLTCAEDEQKTVSN